MVVVVYVGWSSPRLQTFRLSTGTAATAEQQCTYTFDPDLIIAEIIAQQGKPA